jgi:hypothetical protein
MPGTDPGEAVRVVFGELPDLPHLPELPGRGPGADLLGRGAAQLVDLHVDLQPAGWRLVDRPGVDEQRTRGYLAHDLDALEEQARDWTGALKVQVAGPWTLAAGIERARGERPVADPGARRDLAESLAEGVGAHLADLRRRVPGARLVVQVDEPTLRGVLSGRVPRVSGRGTIAPIEAPEVVAGLARVLSVIADAGALPIVHCCAARPPVGVMTAAGARGVSVDAGMIGVEDDEALGSAVEAGVALFLGLVPSLGPGAPPSVRSLADPARALWRRLGFPPEQLAETVVVTPACGLAGASVGWMRTALQLCRQTGRVLVEAPE